MQKRTTRTQSGALDGIGAAQMLRISKGFHPHRDAHPEHGTRFDLERLLNVATMQRGGSLAAVLRDGTPPSRA